jgi:hypothetical protein
MPQSQGMRALCLPKCAISIARTKADSQPASTSDATRCSTEASSLISDYGQDRAFLDGNPALPSTYFGSFPRRLLRIGLRFRAQSLGLGSMLSTLKGSVSSATDAIAPFVCSEARRGKRAIPRPCVVSAVDRRTASHHGRRASGSISRTSSGNAVWRTRQRACRGERRSARPCLPSTHARQLHANLVGSGRLT